MDFKIFLFLATLGFSQAAVHFLEKFEGKCNFL